MRRSPLLTTRRGVVDQDQPHSQPLARGRHRRQQSRHQLALVRVDDADVEVGKGMTGSGDGGQGCGNWQQITKRTEFNSPSSQFSISTCRRLLRGSSPVIGMRFRLASIPLRERRAENLFVMGGKIHPERLQQRGQPGKVLLLGDPLGAGGAKLAKLAVAAWQRHRDRPTAGFVDRRGRVVPADLALPTASQRAELHLADIPRREDAEEQIPRSGLKARRSAPDDGARGSGICPHAGRCVVHSEIGPPNQALRASRVKKPAYDFQPRMAVSFAKANSSWPNSRRRIINTTIVMAAIHASASRRKIVAAVAAAPIVKQSDPIRQRTCHGVQPRSNRR